MTEHNIINEYIAGAIGGAAGLVVGHPFDTTKVQLQTRHTTAAFKGSWHAMKLIKQSGQWKGFFRGLSFPLASYAVVNSVFFGVYGNTLRLIQGSDTTTKPNYRQIFVAGSCAGFFQLFVACPVDVVKVVLQSQVQTTAGMSVSQRRHYFTGPVQCLLALYQSGGIRNCYRGFGIQACRDLPASGAYFVVYDILYSVLTCRRQKNDVFANLLAGGSAGVLSWSIIVPFDVVKSRIQADYTGSLYQGRILTAIKTVYSRSGLRGFYSGWLMICIRAFPVNGATFVVYAKSKAILNDLW